MPISNDKKSINNILSQDPELDNSKLLNLAREYNLDISDIQKMAYKYSYIFLKEFIMSGLSKGLHFKNINKSELDQGIKIEKEHTDNKMVAKKIALDHLMEDPLYYTHLIEMEEKYS